MNVNCISKIWVLKLVGQQFSWPNMLGHFLSFFYFTFDHRSFTVKMLINKENLVRFLHFYFPYFIKYFSCGSSMLMSYFSLRKTNSRNHFRSSFQSFYNAINQLIQKLFLLLVSYTNPDLEIILYQGLRSIYCLLCEPSFIHSTINDYSNLFWFYFILAL